MTPLTPAGQALLRRPHRAWPKGDEEWAETLEIIERQAADHALAELRREVEAIRGGAEADRCNARVLALIDKASKPEEVEAALTDEDEIAHGEAVVERHGELVRLGSCAYCDDEWPCRTQRGIERLRAALINKAPRPEEGA